MMRRALWMMAMAVALACLPATAGVPGRAVVGRSLQPAWLAAARIAAAGASMKSLAVAVRTVLVDTGRLPSSGEGLLILVEHPQGVRGWRGPYISTSSWQPGTLDPWGNGYHYVNTTRPGARQLFTIISSGPDGVPDTAGNLRIDG